MPQIEIRYFATLRKNGKKKETLQIQDGFTVAKLAEELGIELDDIAILLVNGIRSDMDETLNEGDIVSLFPPVGGG
jgi:sulfur carrier protein